jgi:hypothetical protein
LFKDTVDASAKGTLQIVGVDKKGRRKILEEQNIVVDNARRMLCQLISGIRAPAQAQKYFITHMAMGDGVDPASPPPASGFATKLTNERVRLEITSITYPSDYAVKFTTLMLEDVGNNTTFTEAGLFADNAPSESEKLFAIKHHGGIRKSDELMLEYNWTIAF